MLWPRITLVRFGECNFLVQYAPRTPESPKGGGLVIRLSESRFLLCELNYSAALLARPNDLREPEVVSLTEGRFENGELVPGLRLNGDEFHLRFDGEPSAVICEFAFR